MKTTTARSPCKSHFSIKDIVAGCDRDERFRAPKIAYDDRLSVIAGEAPGHEGGRRLDRSRAPSGKRGRVSYPMEPA